MKLHQLRDLLPQLKEALGKKGREILVSPYHKLPVEEQNFFEIPEVSSDSLVVFVDGGNAEVLGGVNFSLQILRVVYSVYKNNQKAASVKKEVFCLTTIVPRKGELFFETALTPDILKIPPFALTDKTISPKNGIPSVSLIPEIARRFLEVAAAKQAIGAIAKNDVVVMDGLLAPRYTGEDVLVEDLLVHARDQEKVILGLAKTSRLMTESGSSALEALRQKSPGGCWRYSAPQKESITTHFARLHEKASHVFRLEIPSFCQDQLDRVLSLLAQNSKDPIFLGYPYGLIATDKMARVQNTEQEYLRIALQSLAGREYKDIAQHLCAINAHGILDTM